MSLCESHSDFRSLLRTSRICWRSWVLSIFQLSSREWCHLSISQGYKWFSFGDHWCSTGKVLFLGLGHEKHLHSLNIVRLKYAHIITVSFLYHVSFISQLLFVLQENYNYWTFSLVQKILESRKIRDVGKMFSGVMYQFVFNIVLITSRNILLK